MRTTISWPSNRYQLLSWWNKVLIHILALTGAVVFLIPFLWMISTSLKPIEKIFHYPPQWIPDPILWRNYTEALTVAPFALYFRNSVLVTTLSVVGQIASSAIVAYGFARLRFPGRDILFIVLLATMMLPWQVTMIPLFILYRNLDWINTYYPLVVPNYLGGNPFFIFLLRQFFLTLPLELDEAAKLDGCGPFRIFWQILLPLTIPGLTTVAIFSFLWNWNEFLWPLIVLNDIDTWTIPLGLNGFRDQYGTDWNHLMAASFVASLPVILIFFIFQGYFIQGIATTGAKG